ncbi:DUF6382 domain-containing protein [Gracilibacillus sp. HCP3S3_G5_1]|uniref:DUF6382 domain-containing protein n=1 Tax=unclassified Gracilibacillus TaxID=2625209 RepID=UPI003F893899
MSEKIYGLTCDFEQQQGHFMTLFREEPTPIHSDELAKIQVNMIKANSIDHVLPLEVQEIDFYVKFYYDISSKKMLSHYVRENAITMHELYELLYEIGSVIKSSKEFMLDEQQYVLHEEFIFVGESIKELYLTYIPLKEIKQKPDLHQEFRELFFRLVGSVTELSGDGVQKLTSYLNGSNFQLDDLLKRLDSLRKNNVSRQPAPPPKPVDMPAKIEKKRIDYAKPTVASSNKQNKNSQSKSAPKNTPVKTERKVKKKEPVIQVEEEIMEETTERKAPSPIIVGCLALLGIAIIWRMYMSFPNEGVFYISIGLSLAVLAACYYFLMVYPKATKKVKPTEKSNKNKVHSNLKKEKKVTASQGISPRQVDSLENSSLRKQEKPEVNSANYFQNLNMETTLLSQPDSTVALDNSIQAVDTIAYLDVDRNGEIETIPLNSESFIIGRQNEGVNYVEDSIGISRAHLEIINNGTSFTVKDLGSKNGSKLNEERMVAYKSYPLKDGDQLKMAKVTYTFHNK